jgi:PsbP-like protein
MYSRISALITVMLAAILSTTIQAVTAVQQTAANKNGFSLYQNSQYRFKIQYPSGWVVNSEPGNISLFSFNSPINKPGQLIQEAKIIIEIRNVSQYLDEKKVVLKNKTAYGYVQDFLKASGPNPQIGMDIRPIRVNSTTVAGVETWAVDYVFNAEDEQTFYRETYMVSNGKLYRFTYLSPPLKVPATLLIVQKMIDSFQFTK